ncbi:MAG TPA: GNAT family N-acetyltransferase [Vitreimonas sp.]|uniref:GNAT family N-acetyltransferase n=1 Tax=Vitreimonas sp. TaxID=3069702 RepID=UPI002D52DFA7|nr:GNAT family N-acetyltransferase [Vitreimonas sp.]HYD89534.1 GNAT family N-acetyltransferase [Vitreimonas sp.]
MTKKQQAVAKQSAKISKPTALKAGHDVAGFSCGRAQIDDWLKNRAKKALESDTARTYVVCRGPKRVIGYYALAAGAVARESASGALSRNAPDPIPVIILARLGVDAGEQGQGIGRDLLADAMRRSLQAARIIGARALLIHALDADAARFYEGLGFARLKAPEETTFFVTMREMREGLG